MKATQEDIKKALSLAEELQAKVSKSISEKEKIFHSKMSKLLDDPKNKVMLIELLDKSFRTQNKHSNFEFIDHIMAKYGVADFFTAYEKVLLFAFLNFGKFAPNLSVPFFINHLREDTKSMVLDADEGVLKPHINERKAQNITLNINLIGEEVLGEVEAKYRMDKYEAAIKSDYINYISIKITTIFSQINIIDFKWSKEEVVKRLDALYALAAKVEKEKGVQKFINLDMEEFRDLELTVAAFMQSIAKYDLKAGIVLQAYLPDSYEYLKKLVDFSKARVKEGKPPIKIRFVKGANMESEETIASVRDWALPTFSRKIDTDSNYFKMLEYVLSDENYKYINVGIASHNIFLIAYAYVRIHEVGAADSFTFEMLEGMSEAASQTISKMQELILYAPVCSTKHFNNAIAYLVRRLDENTADDNFMRYSFDLKVGDHNWETQKQLFLDSIKNATNLSNETHRKQNRLEEQKCAFIKGEFANEADTDFILAANRQWAQNIVQKYENMPLLEIFPSIYKKEEDLSKLEEIVLKDKIHSKVIGKVKLANRSGLEEAIAIAANSSYTQKSHEEIHDIFRKAAQLMRERRGDLIGIAALEVGKTFLEIDPEVSEAIDFLEFYPYSLAKLKEQNPRTRFSPKGVVVSIAPWNFPIGITAGCIGAPLAAGNAVIYKPSSLSPLSGYMICQAFWDAGVPKDALIYLPSKGADISRNLLRSTQVKACILTGGEDTAKEMLAINPTLNLCAETGGKNATIVTARADRDGAIKNIIHSAFSNSGQKCSATSLLVLEREVYEDENFKACLIDAAKSMEVGSPFVLKNKIGALALGVDEKLKRAIKDEGGFDLEPRFIDDNPHLMSPGIRYGVSPGDFCFDTELFAPVLSVVCAKDLKDAISMVNSTGYGLTAGLESLDEREWEYFHTHIEAGNIYINKPTTGAVVLRQPFGGVKKSSVGFGRKVGIFNYITQFLEIYQDEGDANITECKLASLLDAYAKDKGLEELFKSAIIRAKSYAYHAENEFSSNTDYVGIRGEDNLFSYKKIKKLGYRVSEDEGVQDILAIVVAAYTLGVELDISHELETDLGMINELLDFLQPSFKNKINIKTQSVLEFIKNLDEYDRVRYMAKKDPTDELYVACAKKCKIIASDRPKLSGRFELLYYYEEKSLSISYHRYGNLGARGLK